MEFIWYIFLFLVTLVLCFSNDSARDKKGFYLFWFVIVILHSVIIRSSGFDTDIAKYAQFALGKTVDGTPMPIEFGSDTWYPKFNQEPMLFLILKYIFILTKDIKLTFIIIDLIIFYVLFLGIRYLEIFLHENKGRDKGVNLSYLYFQILVFFPQVFSMQAVYRQYLASVLLLTALSALFIKKKRGYLFFLFGILSHNSAAVFLPLVTIFNVSGFGIFLVISAMITFPLAFNYFLSFYDQYSIGYTIAYIYLAVQSIIFFFVYFLYSIKSDQISNKVLFVCMYVFYLTIIAVLMSESNIVERLSLFCLFITYPLVVLLVEKKFAFGRSFIRVGLTTGGFLGCLILFPGVIGL